MSIHIGSRIRVRRELLRLSSERLAVRLGTSLATLEAFESGEQRVCASTLLRLTDLLGVSLRYFFDGPHDVEPKDGAAKTTKDPQRG